MRFLALLYLFHSYTARERKLLDTKKILEVVKIETAGLKSTKIK
jgi:hypothetical protein